MLPVHRPHYPNLWKVNCSSVNKVHLPSAEKLDHFSLVLYTEYICYVGYCLQLPNEAFFEKHLPIYAYPYIPTYLPTYSYTYLPTYLPIPTYQPTYIPMLHYLYISTYLYLPTTKPPMLPLPPNTHLTYANCVMNFWSKETALKNSNN